MLKNDVIEELNKNWGDKANAMNCYTEVKFIDELTGWFCYVYALDPSNDDTIACILPGPKAIEWSLKELYATYNTDGEYVAEDTEFRRIRTAELFKRLSGGL